MNHLRRSLLLGLALLLSGCGLTGSKPAPLPPVVAAVEEPAPPPRIALALGGGAARGFAHIGVIKVLESHGLKVDLVVGTSAGSVAGALFASGYSGFDLQQMAFDLDRATVADWTLFGKGLIRGDALRQFVNTAVGNRPLEKLPLKFACVAANLKTGEAILFERGETGQAVQASSAVPGVFAPTVINGAEYVDGGLVSVVPIRYAKKLGADFVIAVDVAAPPDQREAQGKLDVVMKTFGIMGKTIRESEYPLADVLIVPDMTTVSSTDFEGKHRAILAGERAAQAALPEIKTKLRLRGVELDRLMPAPAQRLDAAELAELLPPRSRDAHKGAHGHILIVGGDAGMGGAVLLAARAALRAGAGLVTVATHATHAAALTAAQPELMVHGLAEAGDLEVLLQRADVLALGPGLGQQAWGRALYEAALSGVQERPLVLDADALNLLAESPRELHQAILTPHPGEAGRLLGISTAAVQANRLAAVMALQQGSGGGVAVLKGRGSLIASSERSWLCPYGNPGMAVAGMGDTLTGIIAGLLGQGLTRPEAARCGVLVHAMAGDVAAASHGERGLLPSDLIAALGDVVNPAS